MRGIRGAIYVKENSKESILHSSDRLLQALLRANRLKPDDLCAIFITATTDLNAAFPAGISRKAEYRFIPFLCSQEMDVVDAPRKLLRMLVFAHIDKRPDQIRHQYIGKAKQLRPDLVQHQSVRRS
ncbi:MAG: chorismate mutase [bacterium]